MRRRRRELQAKIETLGEAENGEASTANDLDSRTRELKSINSSIQSLTKKAQGADPRLPQDDSQTKSREIPKMIILTFFQFDYCSYL